MLVIILVTCCSQIIIGSTAVYSVVTATNFTWYSSICHCTHPTGIEYFSLSGLCAFQTLTLTPPVKISQIQPCADAEWTHMVYQSALYYRHKSGWTRLNSVNWHEQFRWSTLHMTQKKEIAQIPCWLQYSVCCSKILDIFQQCSI